MTYVAPTTVAAIAPARLHFALTQMSMGYTSVFGGFGVALRDPFWELDVAKSAKGVDLIDGLTSEHAQYAHALLLRLRARMMGRPLHISVKSRVPAHVGLGSKTSLGNAVLAAALRVWEAGTEAPGSHRDLLHRGGASGIGVNLFDEGGFVLDAGRVRHDETLFLPSGAQPPSDLPALIARWPAGATPVVLARPRKVVGLHGADEVNFWRGRIPLDRPSVDEVASVLLYEVLPGLARADFDSWTRGLSRLQHCGFKAHEWTLQPRAVVDIRDTAYSAGAAAVALSGMGPTLAIFGWALDPVVLALKNVPGIEITRTNLSDSGVSTYAGRAA